MRICQSVLYPVGKTGLRGYGAAHPNRLGLSAGVSLPGGNGAMQTAGFGAFEECGRQPEGSGYFDCAGRLWNRFFLHWNSQGDTLQYYQDRPKLCAND